MRTYYVVGHEVNSPFLPEEDEIIRECMLENIGKGKKVYIAAKIAAEQIRNRFGINRSSTSIKCRWYKIKNQEKQTREETAACVAKLAQKISALERHVAEQDKLIRSLLEQLEIAYRCVTLLKSRSNTR